MGDIVEFKPKSKNPKAPKRKALKSNEVEIIGFLTVDNRDLWIRKKEDIEKIIAFIAKNKITIFEGEED